jgi:hypothetical protein
LAVRTSLLAVDWSMIDLPLSHKGRPGELGQRQTIPKFDFEAIMDTVERGAIEAEKRDQRRDGDDVEKQAEDGGRGLMDATG